MRKQILFIGEFSLLDLHRRVFLIILLIVIRMDVLYCNCIIRLIIDTFFTSKFNISSTNIRLSRIFAQISKLNLQSYRYI